jgi:SAM-dependent methyltransferase
LAKVGQLILGKQQRRSNPLMSEFPDQALLKQRQQLREMAHRPPFAAPCFDLVVCHNSFPHFADKPAALNALARLLRPGGHLLILHDLSREKVNAIHSGGGAAIQNDLLPPGEETGRMLMQAGFVGVHVEDNDEHYVVAGHRNAG